MRLGLVAADTITMTIGHGQPANSARHMALLFFEQIVETASNGQIDVEVFPAEQLGNEAELMESVQLGVIQATEGGNNRVEQRHTGVGTLPAVLSTWYTSSRSMSFSAFVPVSLLQWLLWLQYPQFSGQPPVLMLSSVQRWTCTRGRKFGFGNGTYL